MGMLLIVCKSDTCRNNPNAKDLTPPRIVWIVTDPMTGQTTRLTGNSNFDAKRDVTYTVLFCPDDDGGLTEVAHHSSFSRYCECGGLGATTPPTLSDVKRIPLGLDAKGQALTSICENYPKVKLGGDCNDPSRCRVVSASFSINGSAKNYANLSTTASLTLTMNK
jgi:hypothetical protein